VNGDAIQPFESFEHWTVSPYQQPPGDVETIVWVNADQMRLLNEKAIPSQALGAVYGCELP
jgi:hypothetical protein